MVFYGSPQTLGTSPLFNHAGMILVPIIADADQQQVPLVVLQGLHVVLLLNLRDGAFRVPCPTWPAKARDRFPPPYVISFSVFWVLLFLLFGSYIFIRCGNLRIVLRQNVF